MTTLTPTPITPATLTTPDAAPQRKLRDPVAADKFGWWWGTGRRKAAVARVRIRLSKDGQAKFVIVGTTKKEKPIEVYFAEERDRVDAVASLKVSKLEGKFDIVARVHGGGYMGQAGAIRLGLARALRNYDPTVEQALRDAGFLTRDARRVERKKYGQAGARRRFQFSKR
jgi:small subunit ribosomal protein S9